LSKHKPSSADSSQNEISNNAGEDEGLLGRTVLLYLVSALLITFLIVVSCKALWLRLTKSEKQSKIDFDCEQAIRKKQRLEQQLQ